MSFKNGVLEALGSILDAPGLDLGSIFRGFGRLKRCLKGFPWWQPLCHRQASRSRPRSVRDLAEPPGRLPRMPVLPSSGSDGRGAHGVGGRRCPPRVVSIRRPPKVVRSVLDHRLYMLYSCHNLLNYKRLILKGLEPLSKSLPGHPGPTGAPSQVCAFEALCGLLMAEISLRCLWPSIGAKIWFQYSPRCAQDGFKIAPT